jgi:hypothetical protein
MYDKLDRVEDAWMGDEERLSWACWLAAVKEGSDQEVDLLLRGREGSTDTDKEDLLPNGWEGKNYQSSLEDLFACNWQELYHLKILADLLTGSRDERYPRRDMGRLYCATVEFHPKDIKSDCERVWRQLYLTETSLSVGQDQVHCAGVSPIPCLDMKLLGSTGLTLQMGERFTTIK